MNKTHIQIPKRILEQFLTASQELFIAQDILEDFLFASDKEFIQKMRHLRKEHQKGRVKEWQELKTGYGV